ncbi:hypothetical protein [Nonomuraea endophytica]|uniref:CU044_5270 family protein n=1 Tax=Nonomuraea endophytica TaxID=714136 RepID=A0A7W8A466_9ACTN|nr:hypothetical protein [Nonomuraea endophytica]MBB5079199.1 hypothetical protein [Nonomuraea endophytica]
MDDLHVIRTVLAKPDPSPEVVARRRLQVTSQMRRRPRGRRARWVLLPAVAAVAAAAFVIVPSEPSSAREVLLVAATAAERAPEGSGTYWHVTVTKSGGPPEEYWYRRDGQIWLKGERLKGEGTLFKWPGEPQPFWIGPLSLTFEELRGLPEEETALTKRLTEEVADAGIRTSRGTPGPAELRGFTVEALLSLISEAPVSSQVRAAAYRALAALPDVTDLGEGDGGRRLELPLSSGRKVVVVDPETARVRNTPVWVTLSGAIALTKGGVTIDAEWTDRLPAG